MGNHMGLLLLWLWEVSPLCLKTVDVVSSLFEDTLICMWMCRIAQQPIPQLVTQNFAVPSWAATSQYQPYSQPSIVDPSK